MKVDRKTQGELIVAQFVVYNKENKSMSPAQAIQEILTNLWFYYNDEVLPSNPNVNDPFMDDLVDVARQTYADSDFVDQAHRQHG